MDGQFEPLRRDLAEMGIQLNTFSNDEHVPEIEHQIRTLKEQTRAIYCTLPFRKVPRHLIIEMIYAANYWLNMFPCKGGISQTMSPRTLLTGLTMNYHRHCRLEFGEYVQTHEEHDNSLNPRTIGALALRPTGNVQGGYFFLSLTTGKVINRMCWTRIPMPQDVIDRVERMACQEHAGTTFKDRDHNKIIDLDDSDNNDSTYEPDDENNDDDDDDDDNDEDDNDNNDIPINQPHEVHNDPGILGGQNAPHHDDEENDEENDKNNNNNNDVVNDNDDHDNDGDASTHADNEDNDEAIEPTDMNDNALQNLHEEDHGGTPGVAPLPPIQVENARTQRELNRIAWMGQQPATYAGRTRAQSRANATTNVTMDTNTTTEFERDLFRRRVAGIQLPPEYEDQLATLKHTVLTQYTLKKGLQVFGPKGTEAVFAEMKQLHDRNVCEPVHATSLSCEQKNKALGYLMFLKQKRCGRIKGRGCADGRKQRVWTNKEDATSPTVSTEAVLLTSVIDAKE